MKRLPPFLLLLALPLRAEFSSLNMGLDYHLRGVAVGNNDMSEKTKDRLAYYSQSARLYMTAWLNEDVEAALRLRSINLWGMETSSAPATVYPQADGSPWVEEAYVHLPNVFRKRVNLTIGRQPITLGDGMLVGSDQGLNALRAQVRGPWDTELDVFTAKAAEALNARRDTDLSAVIFRAHQRERKWDLGVIQESHGAGDYRLGFSTYTATRVLRRFYDVRLFGDLKDAYYKIEVAVQQGDADLVGPGRVKIKGVGQRLELGAQKDTQKWGRFGVRVVYAAGSGDDNGSNGTDEAFRPAFAHRWDGLQRAGYGSHFAATLSDVYDPSSPFTLGPTGGLPAGVSGVRTTGLGIHSTQKVFWTGALDYYTYESRTKPTGLNDLGAELDGRITYRYSGFVTFTGGAAFYFPGAVFPNASRVTRLLFETHVHF